MMNTPGQPTEINRPLPQAVLTADIVVAAARSFIGTPFKHQSQNPEFGLDCRGLLLAVGNKIGYKFTGREWPNDYQAHPDPDSEAFARKAGQMLEGLETEFERVWGRSYIQTEYALADARATAPGNIAHIQFNGQPLPTHCGIITANEHELTIIHARGTDQGGEVIEEALRRWLPSVAGVFAWKGVA